MSESLAILDTGLRSADRNVALTAALAEAHRTGRIGAMMRLCRYEKSVLIGQSQNAAAAAEVAACARLGVPVVRRMTGGGAVFMAEGALAWDLVISRRRFDSLDATGEAVGAAVARALAGFGVAASFRPPGDVVAGGRKIAGSGGWFDGDTLLHQGTVLIDTDLAEMAELLRLPPVAGAVTTLAALGAAPDTVRLGAAIAQAVAAALGMEVIKETIPVSVLALAERLHASEDWLVAETGAVAGGGRAAA